MEVSGYEKLIVVVEIVAAGQHHQCWVLHCAFADHPCRKEQHSETLTAVLRVPDGGRPQRVRRDQAGGQFCRLPFKSLSIGNLFSSFKSLLGGIALVSDTLGAY